jgi:hypothetical protein
MCKEPVRELTPRDGVHDPAPPAEPVRRIRLVAPDERADGHYSRWEAGPTSFGPAGRLAITVLVGVWLLWCFSNNFVILCLPLGFVAGVVLRDVWKRTWIPAGSGEDGAPPTGTAETGSRPDRETRPAPVPIEIPTATKVAWACLGVVGLAACLGFAFGSVEMKAAILMAASLSALALWYSKLT